MAKAFKCDVCKQYEVGSPFIFTIVPPFNSAAITTMDVCEKCFILINETIKEQRGDYFPDFKEYM